MIWFAALAMVAQVAQVPQSRRVPGPEYETPGNVLVILVDDLGVDLLEAYQDYYPGTPTIPPPPPTPAIDSLVRDGMLFTNSWTNPKCSPTRAQILTGLYGRRTGIGRVTRNSDSSTTPTDPGLQPGFVTLPQLLRNGPVPYVSAALGKWHLADPSQPLSHAIGSPGAPWFDYYAGSMHNLLPPGPGYNDWEKTFVTGIDPMNDPCQQPPCVAQLVVLPNAPENYATTDTTDDAIHMMQRMEEPWFMFLSYNAIHDPIDPPGLPLVAASCDGRVTNPNCSATAGDVPEEWRCMLQWLDNELGRLLCAIDTGGPDRPTTVLFTSDNGTPGFSDIHLAGAVVPPFIPNHGKGTLYQGGVNVPLIVRGPRVAAGAVCDALVSSTDLFATVAELARVPTPNLLVQDSISIVPYFSGVPIPSRRKVVYAETFGPNFVPDANGDPSVGYQATSHNRAIRNGQYKLIVKRRRNSSGTVDVTEELYDLKTLLPNGFPDVFETNDLFGTWTIGGGSTIDRNYQILKNRLLPALL